MFLCANLSLLLPYTQIFDEEEARGGMPDCAVGVVLVTSLDFIFKFDNKIRHFYCP